MRAYPHARSPSCLLFCGLRRGEIAALRWGNVDLATGQLAILESAEQAAPRSATRRRRAARAARWRCQLVWSKNCARTDRQAQEL